MIGFDSLLAQTRAASEEGERLMERRIETGRGGHGSSEFGPFYSRGQRSESGGWPWSLFSTVRLSPFS